MINGILDQDLYKILLQNAILQEYPDVDVVYEFRNRGTQRFNYKFLSALKDYINTEFPKFKLSIEEKHWIKEKLPFLPPSYLEYLYNFRYNPNNVIVDLDDEQNLVLKIIGKWHNECLWEVPLMATISELYFQMVDTKWLYQEEDYSWKTFNKADIWNKSGVKYSEFGTRRRRSFSIQDCVVMSLKKANGGLLGTSNMFFAKRYGIQPIGTHPHEWIQGISGLESLNYPNRIMMQKWLKVYKGNLAIALTDTFGTDAFLKDFNLELANSFKGVRQDSGDPMLFVDKIVHHYKKLGIDPMTKTIIFSDNLKLNEPIEIKRYCENKINATFGIGTFLTNDIENSKALNMVIKLQSVNGDPVVKLSDVPTKNSGDKDAIKVANWIFNGIPLNKG